MYLPNSLSNKLVRLQTSRRSGPSTIGLLVMAPIMDSNLEDKVPSLGNHLLVVESKRWIKLETVIKCEWFCSKLLVSLLSCGSDVIIDRLLLAKGRYGLVSKSRLVLYWTVMYVCFLSSSIPVNCILLMFFANILISMDCILCCYVLWYSNAFSISYTARCITNNYNYVTLAIVQCICIVVLWIFHYE